MRGVILAGGLGTRLGKLTSVINKHLVAVGNLPMIEYPLATLKKLGVSHIRVVTGYEHVGTMTEYFAKEHPNINTLKVQHQAGGIAQALGLLEDITPKDSKFAVILGDNIFINDFSAAAREFEKSNSRAMVFLKQVPDPERFGVAEIRDGKIVSIEEKPKNPKSNLAVTGLYFYDSDVFEKIKKLKPSARGELEITDVNKMYLEEEKLDYYILNGFWSDSGTPKSRKKAEDFIYENKHLFIDIE